MEERLTRLENKLDKITDVQSQIQANLQEHMRRTLIAESNIDKLAMNMAPVQEHVAFVSVMGKILTILAAVGSAVAAFIALK